MRRDLRQSGVGRPWLWDTLFGATVPFLTKAVNKAAAIAGRAPLIDMPGQPAASACQSDPAHAERVADAMIANWQRANLLLIYEGHNFVGVLQPVAYVGSTRTDYLVLDESLRGDYEAVYPILRRKLAEQTEITVVDLTRIFDSGESVYMDWAHVSGRGNELVAAALRDALPGAAVLLGWKFDATELHEAWDCVDQLRWIQWPGAGVDAVLCPFLVESNIVLTNMRGVFDRAIAEYVLGLILAFAKDLPERI